MTGNGSRKRTSCYQRTGKLIPVAVGPIMPPRSQRNYGARICHTATNDEVCPFFQCRNNAPAAKIGHSTQRIIAPALKRTLWVI